MFTHLALATQGLYPGRATTASIATLGFLSSSAIITAPSNSAPNFSLWHRRRDFVRDEDDKILVIVTHKRISWQQEYIENKYSKIVMKAKLTGEKKIEHPKKSISVAANINKPAVKVVIKMKK